MEAAALLRGVAIFADLDDDALATLGSRCVSRQVSNGHLLFTAGEPCRGLYLVVAGSVRVYRTSDAGREQVLHVEGPGRPVAELPLFDGGPYPASAITVEPSTLLFLARSDFEALYRARPDAAQAIIRGLGRRLRHLVQLAETLAFRDVAARLAMWLADFAEEHGRSTADGVEITLNRTQEELSIEIGTARESVSRALRELRQAGLIVPLPGDRIAIPDVVALRDRAHGSRPDRRTEGT
jgi:CRP/FNR family transcriptional regulator